MTRPGPSRPRPAGGGDDLGYRAVGGLGVDVVVHPLAEGNPEVEVVQQPLGRPGGRRRSSRSSRRSGCRWGCRGSCCGRCGARAVSIHSTTGSRRLKLPTCLQLACTAAPPGPDRPRRLRPSHLHPAEAAVAEPRLPRTRVGHGVSSLEGVRPGPRLPRGSCRSGRAVLASLLARDTTLTCPAGRPVTTATDPPGHHGTEVVDGAAIPTERAPDGGNRRRACTGGASPARRTPRVRCDDVDGSHSRAGRGR